MFLLRSLIIKSAAFACSPWSLSSHAASEGSSHAAVERGAGLACGSLMSCEALQKDFKAESDCADGKNACHKKYLFKTHGAVIHMVGTCDSFLMMLGSFNSQNHCRYHKILSSVAKKVHFM